MKEENQIQKAKSFEEKMMDRIKNSVGDLMTDEDLKKILEKSMTAMFFTETYKNHGYHREQERIPGLAEKIVTEHLKDRMDVVVGMWLEANSTKVREAVDKALEGGLATAMTRAMNSRFEDTLSTLRMNIDSALFQGTDLNGNPR